MDGAYTAKATGDITCVAETDVDQWTARCPTRTCRCGCAGHGGRTVVIEGVIRLSVTPKK